MEAAEDRVADIVSDKLARPLAQVGLTVGERATQPIDQQDESCQLEHSAEFPATENLVHRCAEQASCLRYRRTLGSRTPLTFNTDLGP